VSLGLRAAVVLLAVLAGCDSAPRTPFNGVDVTGAKMGDDLGLKDPAGKVRSISDFRGKVVAVNFGYTQCPDVCPTTLSDLNKAVKKLGADGSRVQVLFVTVDPKRDKPELLREYVPAFNPSFVGLYGDEAATRKVTDDFKIYAQERPGANGTYTVDHSAQTFVYDPQGRLRLVIGFGATPDAMASDFRLLLNSPA
jgi:protein SCO1/2